MSRGPSPCRSPTAPSSIVRVHREEAIGRERCRSGTPVRRAEHPTPWTSGVRRPSPNAGRRRRGPMDPSEFETLPPGSEDREGTTVISMPRWRCRDGDVGIVMSNVPLSRAQRPMSTARARSHPPFIRRKFRSISRSRARCAEVVAHMEGEHRDESGDRAQLRPCGHGLGSRGSFPECSAKKQQLRVARGRRDSRRADARVEKRTKTSGAGPTGRRVSDRDRSPACASPRVRVRPRSAPRGGFRSGRRRWVSRRGRGAFRPAVRRT